jgi:hypothetical protein
MVFSFYNKNFFEDIVYLLKEFNRPVYIRPVALTVEMIKKINKDDVKEFLKNVSKTIKLIEQNDFKKYICNYNHFSNVMDITLGPTVDYDGTIYTTRCFVLPYDDNVKLEILGNILK